MITTLDKIRLIEEQLPLSKHLDWVQPLMEGRLRELKKQLDLEQSDEIGKSVWLDTVSRIER